MKKKKVEKKFELKIKEVARFACSYIENAQNIAMALSMAGRFVQIERKDIAYVVVIYERDYD